MDGDTMLAIFLTIENESARSKTERIYFQYRYLMFSEANKILNDSYLAEDAVSQSFLKIIKNLHKIDENNVPATRSFVVIICRNVSLDILKNKNNNTDIDDLEIESGEQSPENIAIDTLEVERIAAAIAELPEIYRDIVLLKHHYDYTREEIAKMLDLPFETVKKRLHRAKKLLTNSLKGREYDE